jgi:soluble lytic murein transglycosylase-like protein
MKRLTIAAAAFAAGTTIYAVHAQEAPSVASPSAPANEPNPAEAQSARKPNAASGTEFRLGRDNAWGPEVDPVTTSSVATEAAPSARPRIEPRTKPRVKAVARKQTIVLPGAAIASDAAAPKDTTAKGSPGSYDTIITRYASTYGVPLSLAHAVIRVESNYRSDARGSAGEIGLMQIKPATARMMGYSGSAKGLFDPDTNIRYGMKYLARAHELGGGDTCGTILRYNAGHAARRMNPVSAAYCSKVKRHLAGG